MLLYVLVVHNVMILRKMESTKDSHFYAPGKTIHNQVKYIIMDHCDQEAKKFRHLISLPEGLLVSCSSNGTALSSFVVGLSSE